MPKYLMQVNMTREGLQGTLREGGTARKAAITKTVENLGGTIEAFYYTFGDHDVVAIGEFPDNITAAALATTVAAAGVGHTVTTPILTCEDIDAVAQITVDYRPPGI